MSRVRNYVDGKADGAEGFILLRTLALPFPVLPGLRQLTQSNCFYRKTTHIHTHTHTHTRIFTWMDPHHCYNPRRLVIPLTGMLVVVNM